MQTLIAARASFNKRNGTFGTSSGLPASPSIVISVLGAVSILKEEAEFSDF